MEDVLDIILKEDAPTLSTENKIYFSNLFVDFVQNCLVKQKEQRSTSVMLLLHPWIASSKVNNQVLKFLALDTMSVRSFQSLGLDSGCSLDSSYDNWLINFIFFFYSFFYFS